ncbi:MAG: glycosyltransferase [Planctomycetota bacterium]|jgi:glycosyltransferase involved in cell wall biosynthesis
MSRQFVFVIDRIGGGGAGNACLRIARGLRKRGHRATIIAIKPGATHAVGPDDDVHWLPDYTWIRWPSFVRRTREHRALARKLVEIAPGGDTRRIDAIIGFLPNAHKALHGSGLDQGNVHYSVRMSLHGELLRAGNRGRWRRFWVRRRLRRVLRGKRVVLCAEALRDELDDLGIPTREAVAIYNPFDVEAIRARAAETAPIPEGDYVVHMGRDHPQKRHDLLLQAFRRVPGPAKLVLLGRHSERIPSLVREFGLEDRVVLAGHQPNPFPWIRGAKLYVCSSDYEGLSNSLIEALICGTPVVSTDCPTGATEILKGELARNLVPCGDAAALATKMEEQLADPIDVTHAPILGQVDEDSICEQYLHLAESRDGQTELA